MVPIFIFVLSTGDIYVASRLTDAPSGTILATFKVSSLTSLQKVGTLSGNSGSYACSGSIANKHTSPETR